METLVQCRSCGEDTNRADWEAAGSACAHCGEITGGTIHRGLDALASLRRRLELELVWRPVTNHA
jgi:hypothetical protein